MFSGSRNAKDRTAVTLIDESTSQANSTSLNQVIISPQVKRVNLQSTDFLMRSLRQKAQTKTK